MTKLIAVKCPQCGVDLQIEEGRNTAYCTYCGARFLIENENEHIYRHIDEAKIRRVEAEEKIRMRELDLEERQLTSSRIRCITIVSVVILLILVIIGAVIENYILLGVCIGVAMMVGIAGFTDADKREAEEKQEARRSERERINRLEKSAGRIQFTAEMNHYYGSNYQALGVLMGNAGFRYIKGVNLKNLRTGFLIKPGSTAGVLINGNQAMVNQWYDPDSNVIINYHGR